MNVTLLKMAAPVLTMILIFQTKRIMFLNDMLRIQLTSFDFNDSGGPFSPIVQVLQQKCPENHMMHQFSSPNINGCGSFGLTLSSEHLFTSACNIHDVCYGNCHEKSTREYCDNQFLYLMYTICDREDMHFAKLWDLPIVRMRTCKEAALLLFQIVRKMGGIAFRASQVSNCGCIPDDERTHAADWSIEVKKDKEAVPEKYTAIDTELSSILVIV